LLQEAESIFWKIHGMQMRTRISSKPGVPSAPVFGVPGWGLGVSGAPVFGVREWKPGFGLLG
jgi:hypothetical protein